MDAYDMEQMDKAANREFVIQPRAKRARAILNPIIEQYIEQEASRSDLFDSASDEQIAIDFSAWLDGKASKR